jgi:hypothetical protein
MASGRTDQAPDRWEIGLAVASTLVAILGVVLVAAPGPAWAAEAADQAGPQNQPSLLPAPVTTAAPTVNAVSDSPSPSSWARVPGWQKVLGVGAILTGLAAVGAGAYLFWLDGQSARPESTSSKYNTAWAGWLLMGGGTAASLGGVALLLVPPTGGSPGHPVAGLALSAKF